MTVGHVSHQTEHASVVVSLGALKSVRLGSGIDRVHQAVANMDREQVGARP